jgi:hypothetical protein
MGTRTGLSPVWGVANAGFQKEEAESRRAEHGAHWTKSYPRSREARPTAGPSGLWGRAWRQGNQQDPDDHS